MAAGDFMTVLHLCQVRGESVGYSELPSVFFKVMSVLLPKLKILIEFFLAKKIWLLINWSVNLIIFGSKNNYWQ